MLVVTRIGHDRFYDSDNNTAVKVKQWLIQQCVRYEKWMTQTY